MSRLITPITVIDQLVRETRAVGGGWWGLVTLGAARSPGASRDVSALMDTRLLLLLPLTLVFTQDNVDMNTPKNV
ncbi:hypothetical protein J6590_070675 [Homalodisca vitripennis]|nr:hypothetical protein J6590_070675 [Homalodisca vitripennis]